VILKTFLELRQLLVAALLCCRELLAEEDLCGFLVGRLVLATLGHLLVVRLHLVESLLELVVPSLFSGGLALSELLLGSILVFRDVLAALDNAVVVSADPVEVGLTHVLAAFLSGRHSLSELGLDLETLGLLKTLSPSLGQCNSVLCGKANLLQFLALGSGVLQLFIDLLESDLFLGDEETVLEVGGEFLGLGGFQLDFEDAHALCQVFGSF